MYIVNCAMYIVHCKLYGVQCNNITKYYANFQVVIFEDAIQDFFNFSDISELYESWFWIQLIVIPSGVVPI